MWRTTKLPVSSITFKLNLSPIFDFNTIHNCKSLVRKNIWANIVKKNKQNVAISEEKLDKIKEYWLSNSNKIILIKDIKKSVWANDNSNKVPWDLKIATALKKEIRNVLQMIKI